MPLLMDSVDNHPG